MFSKLRSYFVAGMFVKPPLPVVLPLTFLGTIANTFSFTYFISTNRSKKRRVKLGNELLCLLSLSDFLISLLTYPNFCYPGERFSVVHSSFILPFQTLAEYSVWVTAMISFTRMYLIVFPLRRLNKRVIHALNLTVFVIMLGYYALLEFGDVSAKLYFNLIYILVVRVTLIVSSSVVCGIVAIYSLHSNNRPMINSNNEEDGRHRHAAITVLVLATVSSLLNAAPIPPLLVIILKQHPEGLRAFFSSAPFLTVPLNSAVNPLIYICRNAGMRGTLKRRCRRVSNAAAEFVCRNFLNPDQSGGLMELEDNPQTLQSNM